MAGPVGIFGVVPFVGGLGSTFTFHEINKTRKNSFAKHRIINSNDLIEDTGFDPIETTIEMMFYRPYTLDPSVSIATLEGIMDAKIPMPLIVGGTPLGRGLLTLYLVEQMTVKMTKFCGSHLTYATVSIKLIEYGNAFGISGPLGSLASIGAGVIGSII